MAFAKSIVVYTALFGKNTGLVEQKNFKGIDFICYTDRDDIKSKTWKVIKVKRPVENDAVRSNRWYKINPHLHLPEQYDQSIYIDANILVLQDLKKKVNLWLKDKIMVHFDHNLTVHDPRDCAYAECEAIIEIGENTGIFKDDPAVMKPQMERFKNEGYPQNNGLIFASVLIRKHKDADVINLMNSWWDTVLNQSKRDQLSFNYHVWKLGLEDKIKVLPGDLREGNPWVYMIRHRNDFRWKVFRTRLKNSLGLLKLKNRLPQDFDNV